MTEAERRIPGTVETEHLLIVPLTAEEFAARRADPAIDPELADAMDELSQRMEENPPSSFGWLTNREIILKETGKVVGSIAYMSDPKEDEEHLLEIGYSIDAPYRCRGYATEALTALSAVGLQDPDAVGMIAGVEIGNEPSRRVLKKCGYRRTDRSRKIGIEIWKKMKKDVPGQCFFARILKKKGSLR